MTAHDKTAHEILLEQYKEEWRRRQYWTEDQAERSYMADDQVRQLVDGMVALMDRLQLTPGELRSLATFAAVRYESRRVRDSIFIPEEP